MKIGIDLILHMKGSYLIEDFLKGRIYFHTSENKVRDSMLGYCEKITNEKCN